MRKILLVMCCVVCFLNTTIAYADTVEIQDGQPQEASDVYKKNSTIKSSVATSYYDCAIPYAITFKQLGGYAITGGKTTGKYSAGAAPESTISKSTGAGFNREFDKNGETKWGCKIATESDTKLNYVEKNGLRFYICAMASFMWKNNKNLPSGFPNYSSSNRGQMFDVILTSGDVVHFVVGDCIGEGHSIGGPATGQDGVWYNFATLNYKQYKHIGHCQQVQLLELWGGGNCVKGFEKKFNIKYDTGKGNKIAYIRMYKKKIQDDWKVYEGVPSGVSYNAGSVTITANKVAQANGGTDTTSGGDIKGTSTGGSSSLLDEGHFIATEKPLHEKDVKFADGSDLTYDEKKNLEMLKEANDKSFLTKAISLLRTTIMFIGIIMTVYCIFFYLIYWFDRVNSLTDFSLLKVISFGKVQTSMDDESSYGTNIEGTKEVNHDDVIRICVIGLMLGMFLVTGRLFKVVSYLTKFIQWFLTTILG